MTRTPQPDRPGLWLYVQSEPYIVECDWTGAYCFCKAHCANGTIYIDGEGPQNAKCTTCHGTGTRKVRLQGWVSVTIGGNIEYGGVEAWIYNTNIASGLHATSDTLHEEMVHDIAAAYRAGTLPANVAEYLEEVEVDG